MAGDISFDPELTQQQFHLFSQVVGQAVYPTPVAPAEGGGLFGFQVGVAAVGTKVDESAEYWIRSIDGNATRGGYLVVPRLVVSKGLGRFNVTGSWARASNADVSMIGGTLDFALIEGGLTRPTIGLRGAWADLRGSDVFDLTTWGIEGFISKGIGPLTPYAGAGLTRTESSGLIGATQFSDEIHLSDQFEGTRLTVGARLSLVLWNLVVEATQAKERTYAARFTFGF